MTTEEMLQLLLGKFTDLENEVKEMRSGIKSLNDKVDASYTHIIKELNRIENKVDANHADVIKELNRIENKVDANLRADIIVINGKIDTAMEEQRLNRRVTQSAISELQFRQEHLEEDLRRSNRRLDNARQL
ncbi:MAG: hypothetical protein IPK14_17705 [Blastocatellia bacterium]|nr:hypothetical protein [Blastocatellia bacterium]